MICPKPAAPRSSGPQRRRAELSSPALTRIPREATKFFGRRPPLRCGPFRMRRRSPPACRSPSRPRWSRALKTERRLQMASIGSFKKVGNEFQGQIVTLSVQAKAVRIAPKPTAPTTTPLPTACSSARPRSAPPGRSARRGPRLPLGQARRSLLQPADLREPVRRRRRRRLLPDLVPAAQERRVSSVRQAPPGLAGRGFRSP